MAIDILKWFVVLEVLGLIGWPIARRLFSGLPSRGYAFAKPLALLVIGYLFWLAGITGFLANTTSALVFVLLLVTSMSAYVAWRDRQALVQAWREQRAAITASELVFIAFFGLWCVYRAYNPDLNYTEKPMDLMFLNSMLRSPTFPPLDPWLSGYAVSYYYFGYLLMSLLARLAGVVSSVAFNLALAGIMGLAASGAFALAYDLTVLRAAGGRRKMVEAMALLIGLLGALFVVFIGNLEGLVEMLNAHGFAAPALYAALDIRNLPPTHNATSWMPDDNWWWWRASRVLATSKLEVIDEFPYFSFLIADLHPHVMALPFALMAVGLALTTLVSGQSSWNGGWGTTEGRWQAVSSVWSPLSFHGLMYSLVLGALGFLNSWDFPTYTGLVVMTYAVTQYRSWGFTSRFWRELIRFSLVIVGTGIVLYLPFYLTFTSQANGLSLVEPLGIRTTFPQTILFWGFFLFIVGSYLVSRAREMASFLGSDSRWWLLGVPGLLVIGTTLLFQWGAAAVAAIFLMCIVVLLARETKPSLAARGADHRISAVSAVQSQPKFGLRGAYPTSPLDVSATFALMLLLIGFALIFVVEFVYIRDTFGSRMNTVFKFYYQAWILIALAGAYLVGEVSTRLQRPSHQAAWLIPVGLLLASVLVYPLASFATQTDQGGRVPTLDGTAYMKNHAGDAAAIAWLRENASPDAVVAEAVGSQYSDYGRVAVQTGIPALLGWAGHELQWRGNGDEAARREPVVQAIFTSADQNELRDIFRRYDVTHVFVGELEKAKFGNSIPLTRMTNVVDKVYEQLGTSIYRVK
jgi:YYY domain-containing protein